MNTARFPLAPCILSLSLLLLPACAPQSPAQQPSPSETVTQGLPRDNADQISELAETLLRLKEEKYILQAQYETRLTQMQDQLTALYARLRSLQPSPTEETPQGTMPLDPRNTAASLPDHSPTASEPSLPDEGSPTMAFHYEIREGRAVILSYQGDQVDVEIPLAIEGYPVTRVEEAAFRGTLVATVSLPYSVTEIGWFAFADCPALTTLSLPASVTTIGYGAFEGCPRLTLLSPTDAYGTAYAESFAIPHREP